MLLLQKISGYEVCKHLILLKIRLTKEVYSFSMLSLKFAKVIKQPKIYKNGKR